VIDPETEQPAVATPIVAPPDGSAAEPPLPAMEPNAAAAAIWDRLEDQIAWYDSKSTSAKRWFTRLKLIELIVAAAVPAIAAAKGPPALLTVLGALVVVLEGSQHLFQFQEHWITYRATCEALRHERFLFIAEAGPYAHLRNRRALLAERVEMLVSREQAKWTATHEESARHETAT
jgi:Protein of unknown function (DUF4231)